MLILQSMDVKNMRNFDTVLAELVSEYRDLEGYITYVFEILDEINIQQMNARYIMCVRYPNWEHEYISIGDKGYLKIREVFAGVDEWFDGNSMQKYRYDDVIFYKFIKIKPSADNITL